MRFTSPTLAALCLFFSVSSAAVLRESDLEARVSIDPIRLGCVHQGYGNGGYGNWNGGYSGGHGGGYNNGY
ncbi:hypothetical protein B0H14DRAFT_2837138 [Mycena olivaceomarginata]|nr:hypothetical protein B0H14DRAFT_2837138 [Mycena olivaceomarginata]